MAIYNMRRYIYANSEQIRFYRKPVIREEKNEDEKGWYYNNWHELPWDFNWDELKIISDEWEKYFDAKKYFDANKKSEIVEEVVEEKEDDEEKDLVNMRSKKVASNRAKNKVYELARANSWDWFLTFTFDREKVDSSNYDVTLKKIKKWLDNQKQRYAPELKYIIIPELHADKVHYHFHGLLADCGDMVFTDSGHKKRGKPIYNLTGFKFGFTTATKVEDTGRVASYIVKYMTKELNDSLYNRHRYLASRNLKKPEIVEYNLTPEQWVDMVACISDDIGYMKNVVSEKGGQRVTYIELKKDE